MSIYRGNAHVYGNNIEAAGILSGKYSGTSDTAELASHVFEDVDPDFAFRARPGDVLVVGENFGSGGTGDQALRALQAAGIAVIAAKSFSPVFLEQAKNSDIVLVTIGDHRTEIGDPVTVDLERGVLINGITHHEAPVALAGS